MLLPLPSQSSTTPSPNLTCVTRAPILMPASSSGMFVCEYARIGWVAMARARTSTIRLAIGENKFFGALEIKALKCQLSEQGEFIDMVAYLQVKDLSSKDNNQVFLFNGWTFASSPTLQSIDHPIYDLWITSCENI